MSISHATWPPPSPISRAAHILACNSSSPATPAGAGERSAQLGLLELSLELRVQQHLVHEHVQLGIELAPELRVLAS
jgi:hypothetical protein